VNLSFNLCAYRWLTGRPCPLCGMTHALIALSQGHFAQAIHFNALSPLAGLMMLTLFWPGRARDFLWTAGPMAFAVFGLIRLIVWR
jgi:hypothetical protein